MNKIRQKPYHLDSFIKHLFFSQLIMAGILAAGILGRRYLSNFWSPFNLFAVIPYTAGLALFAWASWSIEPYDRFYPSRELVTAGAYQYSRNPLILLTFVMLVSVGLLVGSYIILALSFVFLVYAFFVKVYREEKKLKERFGEDYEKYCAKTRRWL
ncbi:MAG: isoprenylcysteine carboxylmethyltransferase family protein [Actinobacteria bacterium]|nr:MAG: isoprenylcysteine carboxylmethyltransferase family protein [Actinomycetota bacterium]